MRTGRLSAFFGSQSTRLPAFALLFSRDSKLFLQQLQQDSKKQLQIALCTLTPQKYHIQYHSRQGDTRLLSSRIRWKRKWKNMVKWQRRKDSDITQHAPLWAMACLCPSQGCSSNIFYIAKILKTFTEVYLLGHSRRIVLVCPVKTAERVGEEGFML